jgi:hypothetical protein
MRLKRDCTTVKSAECEEDYGTEEAQLPLVLRSHICLRLCSTSHQPNPPLQLVLPVKYRPSTHCSYCIQLQRNSIPSSNSPLIRWKTLNQIPLSDSTPNKMFFDQCLIH